MIDLNSPGIYIYKVGRKLYIGQAVNLLNRLVQHHEAAYLLNEAKRRDSTRPLLKEGMVWDNSLKIYCWTLADFKKDKNFSSIYKSFSNVWHFDKKTKRNKVEQELDFWEFMLISYAKFYGVWELTNKDFGAQGEFYYQPNIEKIKKITKKYKWESKKEQEDFINIIANESASVGNFATRGEMGKVIFPILRIIIKKMSAYLEESARDKIVEVLSDYMIDEITETIVCACTGKSSTTKKVSWEQTLRVELNKLGEKIVRYFAITEKILEIEGNSDLDKVFIESIKKQIQHMIDEGLNKISERLDKMIKKHLQPKNIFKSLQNGVDEVSTMTVFGKDNFFFFKMPEIDSSKIKISKEHWVYKLNKLNSLEKIMKDEYCCNNNDIFIDKCKNVMKKSYSQIRKISINSKDTRPTLEKKIKENYSDKLFSGYNKDNSTFIKNIYAFYIEQETSWAIENNSFFTKKEESDRKGYILVSKNNEKENIFRNYYFKRDVWEKVEDAFQSDSKITIY